MSKNIRRILLIIIALSIILAAAYALRLDRFGLGYQIDYVDCVYINNQLYVSGLNPDSRTPVDSSSIDLKIGEVKFTLLDNVHSPYYINRNGDAAYLDIGTEIFSIKGQNNAVAVKVGELYYQYRAD